MQVKYLSKNTKTIYLFLYLTFLDMIFIFQNKQITYFAYVLFSVQFYGFYLL